MQVGKSTSKNQLSAFSLLRFAARSGNESKLLLLYAYRCLVVLLVKLSALVDFSR